MSKILSRIKYPKLLLLLLTFIIAYFIFRGRAYLPFHNTLQSLGYVGNFIVGIFFSYGFTAASATAILLILAKAQNIILGGLIAGFGALIGDLVVFKFVRYSFMDEIDKLSKEKLFHTTNNKAHKLFRKYFIAFFACFIIASPLPDEIGVSLLASITKISTKSFSLLSYTLNTVGIFFILKIGTLT